MDSSISHDPFAPDPTASADFRQSRWERAGATPEEAEELANAHLELDRHTQGAEGMAIDRTSDNVLAAALERMREAGELTSFITAPPAPADAQADTTAADELAAAAGEWKANVEPLTVDGEGYPTWDLDGGWVGTRVGGEVDGVHLVAPDRDSLADKVRSLAPGAAAPESETTETADDAPTDPAPADEPEPEDESAGQ